MRLPKISARRAALRLVAALAAVAVCCFGRTVHAHDPFEITTDAKVFPDRLQLHVAMSSRTAAKTCWGLGRHPNDFEQSDLDESPEKFQACARDLYRVTSAGEVLSPKSARVHLSVEHDFEAMIYYPAPKPGPLRIEALHLARMRNPNYGAVLTAVAERVFLGQTLLRADAPALDVELPGAASTALKADSAKAARAPSFAEFFQLGVHHILSGYDHLLFLLGVLLACRTLRQALILVTGFTVGHSLTLALSTLELVVLPSRVVEPMIAATLAVVGIETLLRGERVSARLPITVTFGMIHGLGFAEALRERGLGAGGAPIAVPLLSFNLGVEVGQVLVGAPLLALLLWLAKKPNVARKARALLAVLVSGAGIYWLVERLCFAF